MEPFAWRSESDSAPPTAFARVGDSLKADDAMKRVRRGEFLVYDGDFHNARQLLSAMGRRLPSPTPSPSALEIFRAERRARAVEHETLGRLLVELGPKYELKNKRAPPEVELACRQAWGPAEGPRTLVSLKTLLGVLGAAEWRKNGLEVPGLPKPIVTHYGVYVPTRTDYIEVLRKYSDLKGGTCFDIGTGTGVLGLLLMKKGASFVVGTDIEPRAVACARENAKRFGWGDRFEVEERALFPDGKADLVVCNPPWVPEPPKNRVDRAVFDEGGQMLEAFLAGLKAHLKPGGRGLLILSDLAERLGLREKGALEASFARHGLTCTRRINEHAKHGRAKDRSDALHEARSKEVTTLYELK